ncbi:hypothetical protein F4801DRAFT_583328 [Xylaria longipes]|nr:hypothetical protein F4801DRAFT_583328 [Xylaria longipes]
MTITPFLFSDSGFDLDVGSTSLGTIWPLLHEQFSAPNSAAFTNLTTPSTFGDIRLTANSRRRNNVLPPTIVVNPNDTAAVKRGRNTLAARKSRKRKAQKLEELEEKIAKLEEERDYWKRLALGLPRGA